MKPKIYVETTIPTFYFEVRDEPEMVARREWTRRWWDRAVAGCELVTSAPVVDEIERGAFPRAFQPTRTKTRAAEGRR